MSFFKLSIVLVFGILISSCSKGLTDQERYDNDIKAIEAYLTSKNLTAQKTVDGIYYIIEVEGSEEKPTIISTVTANYTGYFLDGEVFDTGSAAIFYLPHTIQGWQKGIPKFGRGAKGKLFIPSKYAYGSGIVAGREYAPLGFDIEVLDF